MYLFKIAQQLLLPSSLILMLLIGVLVFLIKRWSKKTIQILLIAGISFYYLFSITIVSDLLITPLINQYYPLIIEPETSIRKIVVLTGSIFDRANEAIRLYFQINDHDAKVEIIISGTSAIDPNDFNQAIKLKQFFTTSGVPEQNIILETDSKNTFESAQNVEKMIGQEPFFLVTSDYHMRRAMLAFARTETNPIPAAAGLGSKNDYDIFDFFPSPGNLEKSNQAFHEYLGLFYYSFIGR